MIWSKRFKSLGHLRMSRAYLHLNPHGQRIHSLPGVSPSDASQTSAPLWRPLQLGESFLNEAAVSEIIEQWACLDPDPPLLLTKPAISQRTTLCFRFY